MCEHLMPHLLHPRAGPDGADLSPSGKELLVLFHDTVYHFLVENNNVKAALANAANILPYVPDPSGTGIAWASDECGYYTSTEEDNPVLRFSDRNGADASQGTSVTFVLLYIMVSNSWL